MFTSDIQSPTYQWASKKSLLFSFIQIVAASLFIGICAQIEIPLYFTPVPLTGQTFAIMLTGALLGSRKGALSVLLYIFEGSVGLPLFSGGGFGLLHLFGPTGGYFAGFVLQAYLIGLFMERMSCFDSRKVMAVLLLSCLAQMGLGALWLAHYVGADQALMLGVYPFLPGEIIKALAVTTFLKSRCKKS